MWAGSVTRVPVAGVADSGRSYDSRLFKHGCILQSEPTIATLHACVADNKTLTTCTTWLPTQL